MKTVASAIRLFAFFALMFGVADLIQAQDLMLPGRDSSQPRTSPNGWVGQTIGTHDVKISYGRPYVKGRDVFGGLQSFGKVWRAGANEASVILIPAAAKVEGEDLAAGVYSLFAIPGESEWTIIFNSQAKIWGTAHNADNDVLRVTVAPVEGPHAEMVTFSFEDVTATSATVALQWATTKVPFTISFGE